MTGYLLDTNVCIHFIKGNVGIRSKIRRIGFNHCYLSEITIAELLYGAANGAAQHRQENLRRIEELRKMFSSRVLTISDKLEEFAEQKAKLRKMGRMVTDFDIFLGATAINENLIFVTRNTKDFINMKGISLENWIDAP